MFLRVSPQKARLVLDLIKGRRVEEARPGEGAGSTPLKAPRDMSDVIEQNSGLAAKLPKL